MSEQADPIPRSNVKTTYITRLIITYDNHTLHTQLNKIKKFETIYVQNLAIKT